MQSVVVYTPWEAFFFQHAEFFGWVVAGMIMVVIALLIMSSFNRMLQRNGYSKASAFVNKHTLQLSISLSLLLDWAIITLFNRLFV